MKSYKLVVGPDTSQISVDGNQLNAVKSFGAIIEQYTREGWSYYSMEPITTEHTQGCFTRTIVRHTFYMMIFVKE